MNHYGAAPVYTAKCKLPMCAEPAAPGWPCQWHYFNGSNARIRHATGAGKATRGVLVVVLWLLFMLPVLAVCGFVFALAVA